MSVDSSNSVTPTQLRADLFHFLDLVLETGEPLEVRRNGRTLRITSDRPVSKMSKLVRREGVMGADSADLADLHVDEWDEGRVLNP